MVLDLDLAIKCGEKVALVGPRESGKSAVLFALLGELFPCGLACVAAASRCYARGALKLKELEQKEILLWDDAAEARSPWKGFEKALKRGMKHVLEGVLKVFKRCFFEPFERSLRVFKGL